ncbi:hypothetical protein HHK36_027311 [Tetracentron sinense]|uniref:Rhamnogalacturonase A/B/Epimerase-like pectate lyase domain-containing protein n=1 Tax=Tetracentron sinense TaxID=13715 RepID=A0A834YGL4_TETSI|nr:hypothetical protein HHK36_027311 [Tetracentron sinense]
MVKSMSLLLSLLFIVFCQSSANSAVYDVVKLGAKPDGRTDSTRSFLSAWAAACASITPAMIYVPKGRFLLKSATFAGNCKNTDITMAPLWLHPIIVSSAMPITGFCLKGSLAFPSTAGSSTAKVRVCGLARLPVTIVLPEQRIEKVLYSRKYGFESFDTLVFAKFNNTELHCISVRPVLLSLRCKLQSIRSIMGVLNWFKISGLEMNPSKTQFFCCNVSTRIRRRIQAEIGTQCHTLPIKYLGLPLTGSRLRFRDCLPLLDRITKRISSWKNNWLSYGGRIQLIQSVLNSFHHYWCSVFCLPQAIIGAIEKLFAKFIWAGPEMQRATYKVAWESICRPKVEGGLGIRRISDWNNSSLLKRVWELASKGNSLWALWFRSNILWQESIWTIKMRRAPSWCVRSILKVRDLAESLITHQIGDGKQSWLWLDPWHPRGVLANCITISSSHLLGIDRWAKVESIRLNQDWHLGIPRRPDLISIFNEIPDIPSIGNRPDRILRLHRHHTWNPFVSWMAAKCKTNTFFNSVRKIAFCAFIYHVWAERNRRIFRNEVGCEANILLKILHETWLKIHVNKLSMEDNSSNRELVRRLGVSVRWKAPIIKWVSWIPPDHGIIALNTDGSRRSNNAGYGCILSDSWGSPIFALAGCHSNGTVIGMELMAIKRGLELAKDFAYPRSLGFTRSKNIMINGLTSLNSQMFHVVINGCQNVNIRGVKITASGNSPNTDGIHVQLSTGATIMNSGIKTGDDCISVGPGTKNLWIEQIACGPGHGIIIGSLGKETQEPGVQNVTVKTVVFTGTQNGLRIKAWGRPSTGFVTGVLFQHAVMNNVQNPIVIDQNYCPRNEGCPGQVSGVQISRVTYQDIHGTSATEVAVKFDCSPKNPCRGIRLEDVKLTYQNKPAESSCANAGGTAYGFVEPTSCL